MRPTTGSAGSGATIEVEGVCKSFGDTQALVGVDLSVPVGTVQGLLGPNGAGKTTPVRIPATLLDPDRGHARISGVDVHEDPNTVRSLIGLAGQDAVAAALFRTILWSVGITAIFAPLTVRRYRKG